MDDLCLGVDRPTMGRVEVVHPKGDLRTPGATALDEMLASIQIG